MSSIETLNSAIDNLLQSRSILKEENEALKVKIDSDGYSKLEQEALINDLKAQLDYKSSELEALVNKISAALGQ